MSNLPPVDSSRQIDIPQTPPQTSRRITYSYEVLSPSITPPSPFRSPDPLKNLILLQNLGAREQVTSRVGQRILQTTTVAYAIQDLNSEELSAPKEPLDHKKGIVYQNGLPYFGLGEIKQINGSTYKGHFENGLPKGFGILIDKNGKEHRGQFDGGFFHNGEFQGTVLAEDGLMYLYRYDRPYFGPGSMTYQDGAVYTGSFQNGLPDGPGILTRDDGSIYKGIFQQGVPHGKGVLDNKKEATISFPQTERVYEGDFQDGLPHGKGKYTSANGLIYEGEFQKGRLCGQTRILYPDGRVLECQMDGRFENRTFHGTVVSNGLSYLFINDFPYTGQYTVSFGHGCAYSGNFLDGLYHGKGAWVEGGRLVYEGDFLKGKPHGNGVRYDADGSTYTGEFFQGTVRGTGRLIYRDGTEVQGRFIQNNLISTDISSLGSARFLIQLYGLAGGGRMNGDDLGIVADFLLKNGYAEYSWPLIAAHQRLQVEDLQKEAENIYNALIENQEPQLLLYGTRTHALGLNLIAEENFVVFEIFNSGRGLDYHPKDGRKYQTMLQIKVPKASLTPEILHQLLNYENSFNTVEQAYSAILNLPGAVKQTPQNPILQTPQAGNNCGVEWIFAYLIAKMPREEYHKMRKDIFEKSIEAAQENSNPQIQELLHNNQQIIEDKLERKRGRVFADQVLSFSSPPAKKQRRSPSSNND